MVLTAATLIRFCFAKRDEELEETVRRIDKGDIALPFPPWLLKAIGKEQEIEWLTGSLLIDSGKIRKVLDWKPPFTMEEGIYETAKWYKDSSGS